MEKANETYNGWNEYKRLVLKQLEDLTHRAESMEGKIDSLKIDVTVLKVKAGIYGGIAGFVIAVAFQLLMILLKVKPL